MTKSDILTLEDGVWNTVTYKDVIRNVRNQDKQKSRCEKNICLGKDEPEARNTGTDMRRTVTASAIKSAQTCGTGFIAGTRRTIRALIQN